MSFGVAVIIVVALAAVALGLVCYHLLGRLELLERAVAGGLEPPSTRLSREQFERRFRIAHARSQLASEIDTGVLLVVGPEYVDGSELRDSVETLARNDLFAVRSIDDVDGQDLGVTTTPYLFIVDQRRIRQAQPVASSNDVIAALKTFA